MADLPTHTYLDITVSNNSAGVQQAPVPCVLYTRRDADYLFRPNDYFVSVARWSIDCRLPMIVPQIPIGATIQTNLAGNAYYWDTIYYVSIKTPAGTIIQENISFYPEVTDPLLTPPITVVSNIRQLYDDPYFYISSQSWWLYLVNKAITTCWTNFVTAYPAFNAEVAPVLEASSIGDGTFSIIAGASFLNGQSGGGNPNPVQLWFNSPLYTLFQFPSQYNYASTLAPFTLINAPEKRLNYLILFNNPVPYNTAPLEYIIRTEMPSLPFWSPISSVSFSSQGIPVEPTNVTPTVVLGSPTGSTTASGYNNNINTANTITDFEINLIKGYEGRTINYYSPQGEYRLIDIIGNRPLSEINIIVYWRDKIEGALHPLYLHSGGGASVKLMFRKRNYYSEIN